MSRDFVYHTKYEIPQLSLPLCRYAHKKSSGDKSSKCCLTIFSMGRRKSQTGDMNLNEDANCDTLEYIMYNSPSPQSPNGKVWTISNYCFQNHPARGQFFPRPKMAPPVKGVCWMKNSK